MVTAALVEITPPVKRYVFTEENTIGDLFKCVNALELAGKPPFLKFLGTRGQIVAAEVLVHDPESHGEMAVAGAETEVPDPAVITCEYCDAIARHPDSIADRPGSEWDWMRETGHFPACPKAPVDALIRKAVWTGGYPI